jgi:hypothetical protein
MTELGLWFDREYGGPLRAEPDAPHAPALAAGCGPIVATHGPWSAAIEPLPESAAVHWREELDWSHPSATEVGLTGGQALYRIDQMLHVARLARGLTLLTQGTAYDVFSQEYLNPSDWRDRSLDQFIVPDHVKVSQNEAPTPEQEWFSTRGLTKFGLDELETFRPVGLSATPVIEALSEIAGALIRQGRAPNVGGELPLPEAGVAMRVLRHRTVQVGGVTISLREIAWSPLTPHG